MKAIGKKLWNWLTKPAEIKLSGTVYTNGTVVSCMASFRDGVIIALDDGTIYHVYHGIAEGQPVVQYLTRLIPHR